MKTRIDRRVFREELLNNGLANALVSIAYPTTSPSSTGPAVTVVNHTARGDRPLHANLKDLSMWADAPEPTVED